MQRKEIEKKIIKRFDELSSIFPGEINPNDFRVKKILKFLGKPSDKKILDLGCGKGRFCRKLKDAGFMNIIGAEPSKELIKTARKNNKDIKFIQASATDLPFSDNEFDSLICIEVLGHIPDTEKAVNEMARVLKPGGKLFIIDKNILSLDPLYFIPTFLWKNFLENINKWFYPRNFLFKEKYFFPWKLNKILKRHFLSTKMAFIRYEFKDKNPSLFLKNIFKIHNMISALFYIFFPFLNLFTVWEGRK